MPPGAKGLPPPSNPPPEFEVTVTMTEREVKEIPRESVTVTATPNEPADVGVQEIVAESDEEHPAGRPVHA